jgi:hypothetical protein
VWQEICVTFQQEPKVEFFRLWRWLAELHSLGTLVRRFPRIPSANTIEPCCGDLRVKRDLTLYALIHFPDRSLLKSLVPAVNEFQLIQAGLGVDLCMRTAPDADLKNRLMACIVSRHLWERLTQGVRWHVRGVDLDEYLGASRRLGVEDWWLEGRIRGWPPQRAAAARELFHRKDPWLTTSPLSHCYQSCLPKECRVTREASCFWLPENWQCRVDHPSELLLKEQHALENENRVFSRLRETSTSVSQ